MTCTEIPLPLSPRQAAEGDIVTVPLPTGVTRIRIPPSQDGDLVRAREGAQEVLLRVQVTGGGSHSYPWAAFLGVAAVIGAVVLLGVIGAEDKDSSAGSPAASSTYDISSEDPYAEQTEDPYTEDPFAEDPYDSGEEAPDPYESGTCLNGTLPDSTTAQEVSGVDEVSCSASDAHYQVIQTIPLTSDMSRCDANSATQYAFSYRYTLDGATLNEYVYCLIGLGSYAR
ncbi:LppU/SCO3897 family protein [[Kitasatospora] papulosa]|uniref:LppU/SCO3897 family protein n=1 Tax=[Kitasatospora] papulosa TaxID=1464011 RepID=UPI0036A0F6EA